MWMMLHVCIWRRGRQTEKLHDWIDSVRNLCRVTDKKFTHQMKMCRRLLDESRFSNFQLKLQVIHRSSFEGMTAQDLSLLLFFCSVLYRSLYACLTLFLCLSYTCHGVHWLVWTKCSYTEFAHRTYQILLEFSLFFFFNSTLIILLSSYIEWHAAKKHTF